MPGSRAGGGNAGRAVPHRPVMPSRSDLVVPAGARGWLLDTNVISELRKGARC
jgi:hypothetical protein